MADEDGVDRVLDQWARRRPDLDTEAMGLLGRVYRLTERARAATATVFAAHDLTGPEFDVLATLLRAGPPHRLTPGALASTLLLTSGGMTARLDRLESRGLVTRTTSTTDARSRLVQLTEDGHRAADTCVGDLVQVQARLVSVLADDERGELADVLRRWLRHAEAVATDVAAAPSRG